MKALITASVVLILGGTVRASALEHSGGARQPTLHVISASVSATEQAGQFGGKASVRVRFCAEIGPRAVLLMRESWKVDGVLKASRNSTDPLGVDLVRVRPYECVDRFVIEWLIPRRLLGPSGIYAVSVRLRDGRGRVTRPVGFSLRR